MRLLSLSVIQSAFAQRLSYIDSDEVYVNVLQSMLHLHNSKIDFSSI